LKMMCYPDLKACDSRYKELLAMEETLYLCERDLRNRMAQIRDEKKAIDALRDLQENWQLVGCEE
jgi:hypothetical protein